MTNNNSAYHLNISVSDWSKSQKFYDELFLNLLGWKNVETHGYSDGNFTIWVVPAKEADSTHKLGAVGFHHFAVRVENREKVTEVFNWCDSNRITVADVPTSYPQYSSEYYSVFFLDPDGMKIEVVYNPIAD